jgi:uncharacterized protein (TIGR02646 family)
MKHIHKFNEPDEFVTWKSKDKMYQRGKPSWDRVPGSIKEIIRENLRKEQGYICCYCERTLKTDDYHIEHLKPKGVNFFPEEQLDYNNLLCSCQFETLPGEPLHCARRRGSWYDATLLVSPLDATCENKFKYSFDGTIDASNSNHKDALITIEKLRLNISKLNALRASAIAPFLDDLTPDELKEFVDGYLRDKTNNNGAFNEFYTTIKHLFAT